MRHTAIRHRAVARALAGVLGMRVLIIICTRAATAPGALGLAYSTACSAARRQARAQGAAVRVGCATSGSGRRARHCAIRTADLRAQVSSLFRWKMRKQVYGPLSCHCRIPVRRRLPCVCSGLRELAMPAQHPRPHGAISRHSCGLRCWRFHQRSCSILQQMIGGHSQRHM